jgi:hypothetical protein
MMFEASNARVERHGSPRGDQRPNCWPGVQELYHNPGVSVTCYGVMPNAHNEHSRLGNSPRRRTRRRPQCYLLLALGFEAAASTSWAELDGDKIKPFNVKAPRLSGWRCDSLTARFPDNPTMCQFLQSRFYHTSLSQNRVSHDFTIAQYTYTYSSFW